MRFELQRFDDEADDLPDDLAIMAEQLSADAGRLAAVYPVRREAAPTVAPRRWTRFALSPRLAVAAVLIMAISGGLWLQWEGRTAVQPQPVIAAVPGQPADPNTQAVLPPVLFQEMPFMFQELSGPEQEAVLDLLEGDSSSLSI